MHRHIILFSIIHICILISIINSWKCEKTIISNNITITFNLCDFRIENYTAGSDYWTIVDDRDIDQSNYSYYFNVADNVNAVPIENEECWNQTIRDEYYGMPDGYCAQINSTSGECLTDITSIDRKLVGAYQMYRGNS